MSYVEQRRRQRQLDYYQEIDDEKLKLRLGAQETIRGNAVRGEKLRTGLESRVQLSDSTWWRYKDVGKSSEAGTMPDLEPLNLDEHGKVIDSKAAKQLPVPELSDFINRNYLEGGIKWPDYVPEEARTEEAYNKWNRQKYYRGKTGTKKLQVRDGILRETGHFTASSKTNIGMNPWVGAQVKYGPEGNQTTTQKYIVDKGDKIQDVAYKFGVSVKQITDANKGKIKKGILTPGEQIKIETIKLNTDDTRLIADLEALDMGGKDTKVSQFKAFEEYIGSFAPESEKGKYLTHTIDTLTAREMGAIGHDTSFDPTAHGALSKVELNKRNKIHREELRKVNPITKPSNEDKFKADLIAKNPSLPNTIGLQRNTSSARTFHDRVKSHLQSQGFQREAARIAGQSNVPWANIAGDFVGVIYDGMEVAATGGKDVRAITELIMSGTQLGTSIVGGALIAFPEPTTSGLGWVVMKAGDNVGRVERLWNMGREGIHAERYKGLEKTDKGNPFVKKNKSKLQIVSKQSGQEVAEMRKEIQTDQRIQEPTFEGRKSLRMRR